MNKLFYTYKNTRIFSGIYLITENGNLHRRKSHIPITNLNKKNQSLHLNIFHPVLYQQKYIQPFKEKRKMISIFWEQQKTILEREEGQFNS